MSHTPLVELFDGQELPPSRNEGAWGKRLAILATGLVALALVVGGFLLGTRSSAPTDFPGPGSGEVEVTVARGASLSAIAQELVDSGVVLTAQAFLDAAAVNERAGSIGPGVYTLRQEMSGQGAVELMLDPASRQQSRLVLPEGLRLAQTLAIEAPVAEKSLRIADAAHIERLHQHRIMALANDEFGRTASNVDHQALVRRRRQRM